MGISVWQLLIILAIVLVLFGAKRLSSLGSDLGNAVKGFRSAVRDEEGGDEGSPEKLDANSGKGGHVYDAEDSAKEKDQG